MFKKSIIFTAVLLGFLQVQSYSQARVTAHLDAGYNIALGYLKGDFDNPADSNTYLLHNGYNFGVVIKRAYGKAGNFRATGDIYVSFFSQSKHTEGTVLIDTTQQSVISDVKLKMSILTVGFGGEWSFSPKRGKLNPFVGAGLSFNLFSGSLVWSDDYQNPTLTDQSKTMNLKHSLRVGVQLGGGIDFQVHQSIGFIIGAKFNWTNVIGKKWENDGLSTYYLKDGEYTSGSFHMPSRNITFLQFYSGFSFYFGR